MELEFECSYNNEDYLKELNKAIDFSMDNLIHFQKGKIQYFILKTEINIFFLK